MIPVTGVVPVLHEVTVGRFPDLSHFKKHLFMSANMIGAFLFAPLAGLLSDWLRQRKWLIAGALVVNAVALYLMRLEWSYSAYLGLRFVEGCAHIASLSLLLTLGMEMARAESSGRVMGFLGASMTLGVAAGAPLGGIIGRGDPLSIFLYGSFLMAALAVVASCLLHDRMGDRSRFTLLELVGMLKNQRLLAIPYLFTFVDRLTVGFVVSTMTFYLRSEMGALPQQIGWIMALFMIPFALLTYPAGRFSQPLNKLKLMIAGSVIYGVIFMAIGLAPLGAISWLMLGGGVAAALMFAPSLVLVQALSGEHNRALAMSAFNTAGSLGFLLGPLFGGTMVGLIGYQGAFLATGALEIICALLFVGFVRRVRV